jgi:hypothetical protein
MKRLLYIFPLLFASVAWGAVSVDANGGCFTASTNTTALTGTITVASGGVLLVSVGAVDNSATLAGIVNTVTLDSGETAQLLGRTRDHDGSELFNYWYGFKTVTTGARTVTINLKANINVGAGYLMASAISFLGANASYPFRLGYANYAGAGGNLTTFSLTMADAVSGDYVVGSTVVHTATISQGANNTAICTSSAFGIAAGQSYASAYRAVSSGNVLAWTQASSDTWSAEGVTVTAADPAIPQVSNYQQLNVGSAVSTLTISNVVSTGCTNGLLLFKAGYYSGSGNHAFTSGTWNSQSLTRLNTNRVADFGNFSVTDIWYIKNPSAATSNLVMTADGNLAELIGFARTYCLVDQTTTFVDQGSGVFVVKNQSTTAALPTVTCAANTTSLVEDIVWQADDGDTIVPTGALALNQENAGGGSRGFSQAKPGASSVVMNWTNDAGTHYNTMCYALNFGAPPPTGNCAACDLSRLGVSEPQDGGFAF